MSTKLPPTPWTQCGLDTQDPHRMREVRDAEGGSVAWCGRFPEEQAHAIARAVATLPDLQSKVERLRDALAGMDNVLQSVCDLMGWSADAYAEVVAARSILQETSK